MTDASYRCCGLQIAWSRWKVEMERARQRTTRAGPAAPFLQESFGRDRPRQSSGKERERDNGARKVYEGLACDLALELVDSTYAAGRWPEMRSWICAIHNESMSCASSMPTRITRLPCSLSCAPQLPRKLPPTITPELFNTGLSRNVLAVHWNADISATI